jgi:hypothetical protein
MRTTFIRLGGARTAVALAFVAAGCGLLAAAPVQAAAGGGEEHSKNLKKAR